MPRVYTYTGNDPLDKTDPSGNAEEEMIPEEDVASEPENLTAGVLLRELNEVAPGNGDATPPGYRYTRSDIENLEGRIAAAKAGTGDGSRPFSVIDWRGYPDGVPKPEGSVDPISGEEYARARQDANNANRAIRRSDPEAVQGRQIHEIKPVKMGGSPVDPANKVAVDPSTHTALNTFWQSILKWWNSP